MRVLVGVIVIGAAIAAYSYSLAVAEPALNASEIRWEYRVVDPKGLMSDNNGEPIKASQNADVLANREAKALVALNRLGADGWELIEVEKDHFYFKRPAR